MNFNIRGLALLAMLGAFVGIPVISAGLLWLLYHLCCAVYFYVGGT